MKQPHSARIDVRIINETLTKKRVVFIDLFNQQKIIRGIDVIRTSTDEIWDKLQVGLLDAVIIKHLSCNVSHPIQFKYPIILKSQRFNGDTNEYMMDFLSYFPLASLRKKNTTQIENIPFEFTLSHSNIQMMEIDIRGRSQILLRFEISATLDNSKLK